LRSHRPLSEANCGRWLLKVDGVFHRGTKRGGEWGRLRAG
jgi:hypothetical protein